jgi:flavin-dependent dehydrogenase
MPIRRAGFIEKWGASFMNADGSVEQYVDFSDAVETPQPQTYQVPRAEFDRLLLDHAKTNGADVRQPAQAVAAAFDDSGATVTYDHDGTRHEARVAVVVDASGRSGFLARRQSKRRFDPALRNVALHAQYEAVGRRSGRRAGDIVIVMRPDRGWFWFIPLSATITSVGVVLPKDMHVAASGRSLEQALDHYVSQTPAAVERMAGARRTSPARFDADYSYDSSQLAGHRWMLVGDAGVFLDPVFSTGVLLAMQSGLEAADAIDDALASGKWSRRHVTRYARVVHRRYRFFRRFVVGFYDPSFRDLFLAPSAPFGIREAVLSVLAGNWRPSIATRLRVALFFFFVSLQRRFGIVSPRMNEER